MATIHFCDCCGESIKDVGQFGCGFSAVYEKQDNNQPSGFIDKRVDTVYECCISCRDKFINMARNVFAELIKIPRKPN